jgi:hypothetical protein
MLDNHAYNLMSQIVEDHRSLWRMRDMYENDSGECGECRELWKGLADSREAEVNMMVEMLKSHLTQ